MKICDLTQFYSPLSGGVKRYVHEKIAYIESETSDEHVLIVPGDRTEIERRERSTIYRISSPLISRTAKYRALLNLRAIGEIMAREKPDIVESSDPYQIAWKAIASGKSIGFPVVGFYHSHFAEAYLRGASKYVGNRGADMLMAFARSYVRNLYNRFAATLVPSPQLAEVLRTWGVRNVRPVSLGVNTEIFRADVADKLTTRAALAVPADRKLLLYVGRLAPEKNTTTLFDAFELLRAKTPEAFHLLVIGDGPDRKALETIVNTGAAVSWIPYCTDSRQLARYYRAADLFVHPGVQETFGLVALESQACGTPVIGIRGSYMDRIILHDQSAWATENSPGALAVAIEDAVTRDLAGMGAEGSRLATAQLAWPRVFDRLFSIYREVIAEYHSGSR